jgi:hypothetical protein
MTVGFGEPLQTDDAAVVMPAAPCFFLILLIPKTNSGGSQRTHRSRVMARWIAAGFSRGRSAPDHRYDVIGLNPQNMQMGRQGCLRTGWYRGKDGRRSAPTA